MPNVKILSTLSIGKKLILAIITSTLVISTATFFVVFLSKKDPNHSEESPSTEVREESSSNQYLTEAEKVGREFSFGNCEGTGPVELTSPPMHEDDFSFITPYGMTIGAHVTPIDHQYFTPTIFNSARDTYEVIAMADGKLVEIEWRLFPENNLDEFRLVFMHSCTFFTYYDLLTSLTPEIMSEFEENRNGNYAAGLDISGVAGQLIGYIGGQTLDFAVWDTETTLSGFVVPEHYESEAWKIYTSDPYDYYSDEITPLMVERNIRTVEPIAGKIDHDIDGRLIGNWFLEDTNGYRGTGEPYYSGHLSIHPDHIDPTAYWVSVGVFDGEPRQFVISREETDPTEVTTETGLVYYDLMDYEYLLPDGSSWDRNSPTPGITLETSSQNNGCVLFQLLEDRKLTVEFIPGVPCDSVRTPGQGIRTYER